VARAKTVLLAAQGLGNDAIARRLDVGRQVVSRWRKRFWGLDVSKRRHTAAAVDRDGQLRLKDFGFDDDAVGRFGMRV
jgi:transposase